MESAPRLDPSYKSSTQCHLFYLLIVYTNHSTHKRGLTETPAHPKDAHQAATFSAVATFALLYAAAKGEPLSQQFGDPLT